MGAWDERPFCNDSILNDIGGLNYSKSELQNIENVLVEYEHYLGNYELGALILDSSAGTRYISDRDKLKSMIDLVNISVKDGVCHESDDFHESSEALLTFCTTSIEYRKQLLDRVLKRFDLYKRRNIFNHFLEGWRDAATYRKLYNDL